MTLQNVITGHLTVDGVAWPAQLLKYTQMDGSNFLIQTIDGGIIASGNYASVINGSTGNPFASITELQSLISASGTTGSSGGGGGGDASAANQATEIAKLTSIDDKTPTLTSGSVPVQVANFPATQPISATALPLPAGASTSALQTTGNTSLGSIDGKIPVLSNGRLPTASRSAAKALVDASVTGTGSSVQIVAANANGTGVQIFNPSATATAWISTTGATVVANAAGTFAILPNGYYEDIITTAVTALIVTGQPLTIKTY